MSMSSATLWLESASHSCPLSPPTVLRRTYVWFYGVLGRRQGRSTATRAHSGSSLAEVRCPRGYHYSIPLQPLQVASCLVTGQWKASQRLPKKRLGWTQAKALPTSANLLSSSQESKIQSETKTKVDAVARAPGEPISHLPADWESIMKGARQKYGARIPEYYFTSQSYFEAFDEKVNEGWLRPETLAQVVSLGEEEAQERTQQERPKQLHLTLDANLTVQTRRRYLSSMPSSIEELRKKYWVMTQMWLLAKMRQPSRPKNADLDEKTWNNFLAELLNCENFNFGVRLKAQARWWVRNDCLEYAFQLRVSPRRL